MLLEHARADRELARRSLELATSTRSPAAADVLTRYAAELQQRARRLEQEAEAAQAAGSDAAAARDDERQSEPPPA